MIKRILSILLALVVLVSYSPVTVAMGAETGQSFSDMPDNWATPALMSAIENGLLFGNNGRIMPDSPLTRAQMAAVITRAFGAVEEGDISQYTDVKETDWFASSIAKAYKMGVLQGYAGKMDPYSNITREQAFAVLARALKLEPSDIMNKTFLDSDEISDWAKGEIYAMVNAGYIHGSNGKLNPKADITRAEFAQLMYSIIKQYVRAAGEYTEVADGNIMVNVPGVTLKNVTINGDLIVGDGVGDGDLVLDNVTIKGRLVARGGGVNSIIIIGGSVEGKVVIAKVDGNIRVFVEGDADVEVIVIDDGKDDVIVEGTAGTVVVNTPDVPVVIQNATVNKIEANCEGTADITVAENAKVEDVVIGDKAKGSALNVNGSITNVETSAPDTKISGTGKVGTVNVNKGADNTSVTIPNTEINNKGASGVTAGGGKEVPENESVTNNSDGSDIVTPPSAGGGSSYVAVSAVSIDVEDQLLEIGNTLKLTATVRPVNATNKRVTWASSDETVATVDGYGLVTAVGKGTAIITVTTVNREKTDSITITVPIVADDAESLKNALQEADDGDTIVLRTGRYELDETLVITKSVKILGPQANVDPRPSTNSQRTDDNYEAILTGDKGDNGDYSSKEEATNAGWLASIFEIRANNVVINGLTLERTYNHIIYSQTADPTGGDDRAYDITGLQILNNIVRHGRGNEGIKIGRSIDALVQYNYIHDILYPGDAIEAYDVKGFRILDNEIDGCSSENGNIRVSNRTGGEPGIVRGNIIKNTEYHFAINAEDGDGDTIIDNNLIENAKAGGIFVYKNTSISEETPSVIEITNNTIDNYATAPVQGTNYRETYIREAAFAIAVSYNLREGIQPVVTITGNTTRNGADGMPVLAFGGGTTDAQAIPTDLSRITVSGNIFDNPYIKYIKTSGKLDISDNTWVGVRVYNETVKKKYDTIQEAIDEAEVGENIIKVFPEYYDEECPIEIVQKEGVKITLEAVGDIILKNQIRIDGNNRSYGEEYVSIKGFTFDFSDVTDFVDMITTTKIATTGYVYAHNIFIEDCTFIGNPNDIVAIRAGAQGGHFNFQIKGCKGENIHSLAQLTAVTGVKVEDCDINAYNGGLNLQHSIDIEITGLTVKAPMDVNSYGVRAGQDTTTGQVNESNTMTISDSNLEAKYPIWLRGDAPGTVIISNSTLKPSADGKMMNNVANGTVNITINGAVYVTSETELRAVLAEDIKRIILGDDITLTKHVNLDKNDSLEFDGNGNTITVEYDGTNRCGLYLASDNISIKNVTITGDPRVVGIDTKHDTKGFTIEDVTFKNISIGFYANPNVEGNIKDCHFEGLGIGIGYGSGASLEITDNSFEDINIYLEIFADLSQDDLYDILVNNEFDYPVKIAEQTESGAKNVIKDEGEEPEE
ncbi:MAG: S-layer homology domain-containing protein [Acetivibrionales bacterium]|jgi:uncharacterized protein YjdB